MNVEYPYNADCVYLMGFPRARKYYFGGIKP